jgi:hypothetical protein
MPKAAGEEDRPRTSVFPWLTDPEDLKRYGVDPGEDHSTALKKIIEGTPRPSLKEVADILNRQLHADCALSEKDVQRIFTAPEQSGLYPGAPGVFAGNLSRLLGRCYEATWSGPGHSSAPVPTVLQGKGADSLPGFLYNDELGRFLFRAAGLAWN